MKTGVLLMVSKTLTGGGAAGYMIGGVIALMLLIYLIYSLIKPEKF